MFKSPFLKEIVSERYSLTSSQIQFLNNTITVKKYRSTSKNSDHLLLNIK